MKRFFLLALCGFALLPRYGFSVQAEGLPPPSRQALFEARHALFENREAARFTAADVDGSGTLSREEAVAHLPEAAQRFSEMDLNQDGELSRQEVEGFAQRLKSQRRMAFAARQAAMLKRGVPPPLPPEP